MPDLPLDDEDLNPEWAAITAKRISFQMVWPEDRDAPIRERALLAVRADHLRAKIARAETQADAFGDANPQDIACVLAGLPLLRTESDFAADALLPFRKGVFAGTVLMNAIVEYRRSKKPVHLAEIKTRVARIPGLLLGSSESCVENEIWRPFRAVAHLWAAAKVIGTSNGILSPMIPCAPEHLVQFLRTAEAIRIEAETVQVYRGSGNLFRTGDAWRVPAELGIEPAVLDLETRRARLERLFARLDAATSLARAS